MAILLHVGLGQAQHVLGSGQHGVGRQGGSPSKQRRRERREAERKAKATASATEESAAEKEILVKENDVAEKSNKTDQKDEQSDKKESEKSEIEFEILIDAHVKCKNYDVVESIEENYQGTLNDLKIDEHDVSRFMRIQQLKEEPFEKDDEKRLNILYKVIVKNVEVAKSVIEGWKNPYKFDDLAFRHAVYDKVQARVQEVQKIR